MCGAALQTRESPLFGAVYEVRAEGVPFHIANDLQVVLVRLNRKRLETILVKVTFAQRVVVQLPPNGMGQSDAMHEARQFAV